jgi:hypothetical protein
MSSTPRLTPFAVPGGLRGSLLDLPLTDLLRDLQGAQATGILSLTDGGARKALYFRRGRVVFATSNQAADRLGAILVREGRITAEQDKASEPERGTGRRQGRLLVEHGALTPEQLWEAVQMQVCEIVFSVIAWDAGSFSFEESVAPEQERITVDLDVTSLIIEGVRRLPAGDAFDGRQPDPHVVVEQAVAPPAALLHAWEEHVLQLVDGERTVLEICQDSDAGVGPTLRTLYALLCTGIVRSRGRKVRALDRVLGEPEGGPSLLESFNEKYRRIAARMLHEVGPIAENVLAKYLKGACEAHPEVLRNVGLRKDGSLDESRLERNLARMPEARRRGALVDALNELLYAELLAVKRTLGPEHESAIVRELRSS